MVELYLCAMPTCMLSRIAVRASGLSTLAIPRATACRDGWREIFVNKFEASETRQVSEALLQGDSLVLMDGIASDAECEALRVEATMSAAAERVDAAGRVRMRADRMLGLTGVALCDAIFHRVIRRFGEEPQLHQIVSNTFAKCRLDRSFFANPKLAFTGGEPAINVYRREGHFRPQCVHAHLRMAPYAHV